MKAECTILPMTADDRQPVIAIFNHYIEHSFAAYREETVSLDMFDHFLNESGGVRKYPSATVRNSMGKIIGFGMLSPYKDVPTFSHTAVITYCLHPDSTGQGVGVELLKYLENEGRGQSISILLANISSRNPVSLKFHLQNGFAECGRFVNVGKKNGCFFDTVWMQKQL